MGSMELNEFGAAVVARWPGATELSVAELSARFPDRKILLKAWRIPGVLTALSADLLVAVERGHPWTLPLVALPDATNAISLPHIEEDGVLCLSPKTAVYQLPVGLQHVEQLLNDAVDLIDQGTSKQNQSEFLVEANSYWTIVAASPQSIWLTKPAPITHAIWTSSESQKEIVLAPDADALKTWANAAKRTMTANQPALMLRLDTPLLPDAYPLTMRDLERFIRAVGAGDLLDIAVRRWNTKSLLPVVFTFQYGGKDVVLGAAFIPPMAIKMNGAKRTGIPGFRTKGRVSSRALLASLGHTSQRFPHLRVISIFREYLTARTAGAPARALANTHVIVAGCGALGGQLAVHLAQAGVGKLTLMDAETLDWCNVGRHVLDGSYVGRNKAEALQASIWKRFPDMSVEAITSSWEAHFNVVPRPDVFDTADLMISLTGEVASNRHLDAVVQVGQVPSVVFGWLEPFGVAAHAIFSMAEGGTLVDCTDDTGLLLNPVTDRDAHPSLPQEASCGAFYQPYSALAALHGVALVGELAVDALLGRQTVAVHRVWVGNAGEFAQNNLSFSPNWHDRLNALGFSRRFDIPIHPH
jgi:hypothetical protein